MPTVLPKKLSISGSIRKELFGKDRLGNCNYRKTDIVADKDMAFVIRNGNDMMSLVTGTGCQLSSLTAAFIAANQNDILTAAASAVSAMGLAGETAFGRLSPLDGNASYRNYIIDAVCNMTPQGLEEGAKYEMR